MADSSIWELHIYKRSGYPVSIYYLHYCYKGKLGTVNWLDNLYVQSVPHCYNCKAPIPVDVLQLGIATLDLIHG